MHPGKGGGDAAGLPGSGGAPIAQCGLTVPAVSAAFSLLRFGEQRLFVKLFSPERTAEGPPVDQTLDTAAFYSLYRGALAAESVDLISVFARDEETLRDIVESQESKGLVTADSEII